MEGSRQDMLFLCCFFSAVSLISGAIINLDGEDDIKLLWKVKGAIYLESGKRLHSPSVSQYLPDDFKYSQFEKTQGIWAVVPSKPRDCDTMFASSDWLAFSSEEEPNQGDDYKDSNGTASRTRSTSTTPPPPECDRSHAASFQFSSRSQLLAVTVWYNFGGNASIRITGGRRQPFVESANHVQSDGWKHIKKDNLEGRTLIIEAIVNKTEDYVLIDRISVETSEPEPPTTEPSPGPIFTSSTKAPRTSSTPSTTPTTPSTNGTTTTEVLPTHEPAPPVSGQNRVTTFISFETLLVSTFLLSATIRMFFL